MSKMPANKYRPFPPIALPDRRWPSRAIERAPIWCSVDLRDGNQALPDPMEPARKRMFFDALVRTGFKQIEVGFPAASQLEFDFIREVIDARRLPDDVTVVLFSQTREHLIHRTFEAMRGLRRTILHLYNSTSEIQRRVVFGLDRRGVIELAVSSVQLARQLSEEHPETKVTLEYSPESFNSTELDFAVEICEAVLDAWGATAERKVILNLPNTTELATPNVYADQIEAFQRGIRDRSRFVLSVHPHNDRGTAVAAAELALMAGAERVEGTLFGNGERTGNVDLITLALNLFTQGIDPELDLHDLDALIRVAEEVNRMPVHPRHPYAGRLVHTAFSGSHQDAIRKAFAARRARGGGAWDIPYLPIDPADLGRTYQELIQVNSQSGRGGVGWVLERNGVAPSRERLAAFAPIAKRLSEQKGSTLSDEELLHAYARMPPESTPSAPATDEPAKLTP